MTPTWRRATSVSDLEPPAHIAALIFDWDGTLADSQHTNYVGLSAALSRQGLILPQSWFDARTGLSTREMARAFARERHAQIDLDRLIIDRDRHYLTNLRHIAEVPAVVDLARRHHGRRPLALATGGGRRTVSPTIDHLGLRPLFDTVVTREDVEQGKPAPDLFLLAAQRLDIKPGRCLVYEDSDEGLQAAARAGMPAVDVRPLRSALHHQGQGQARQRDSTGGNSAPGVRGAG
jgi:beta-phosphoglucomutase-like phosphatase (HAD superfamily)